MLKSNHPPVDLHSVHASFDLRGPSRAPSTHYSVQSCLARGWVTGYLEIEMHPRSPHLVFSRASIRPSDPPHHLLKDTSRDFRSRCAFVLSGGGVACEAIARGVMSCSTGEMLGHLFLVGLAFPMMRAAFRFVRDGRNLRRQNGV